MSLFRIAQHFSCLGLLTVLALSRSACGEEPMLRAIQPEAPLNVGTELPAPPAASLTQPNSVAAKDPTLSLNDLIERVRAANPSLRAMIAAWESAAQRFPQAVSLDDPMFMAMVAPASFGSDQVDPGYTLQVSQKFPWLGKRAARGRQAQAEAQAAYDDVQDNRNRLDEITRNAYYQYYLSRRSLELNRQNVDVICQFQKTARSKYEANQVTQQDVLQAELELAELERRNIELERADRLAFARINILLHNDPYSPLAPPPATLPVSTKTLDRCQLQQMAMDSRPDLAARRARVRAAEAAVTLAYKNYYPDTEVFGRYDAMWQEDPLKPAVGVNLNVPIYRGRLNAAVTEARTTVAQKSAEYEQLELDVQYEVTTAYEEIEESRKILQLYSDRLLPAAQQNVAAARSNYDVSKSSFLDLATAQQKLVEIQEKREEALAMYHSRCAELMRAVGGAIRESGDPPAAPLQRSE